MYTEYKQSTTERNNLARTNTSKQFKQNRHFEHLPRHWASSRTNDQSTQKLDIRDMQTNLTDNTCHAHICMYSNKQFKQIWTCLHLQRNIVYYTIKTVMHTYKLEQPKTTLDGYTFTKETYQILHLSCTYIRARYLKQTLDM